MIRVLGINRLNKKMTAPLSTTLLILAGGQGSRMGYVDKGQVLCLGEPLALRLKHRLEESVEEVVVSVHDTAQAALYMEQGFATVLDKRVEHVGPLAGLEALESQVSTEWVVTAPCDLPQLDNTVVKALYEAALSAPHKKLFAFRVGEFRQPAVILVHRSLLKTVTAFLEEGERKMGYWLDTQKCAWLQWEGGTAVWVNVNTMEALRALENELKTKEKH